MTAIRAIVPVKRFSAAKTRLAPLLSAFERDLIARAMLNDVLNALAAAEALSAILVVTDDPDAREVAVSFGAAASADPVGGDLNTVIAAALHEAHVAGDGAIVAPSDLPLLQPADVNEAITLLMRHGVVLSRAHRDGGTNLLGLRDAGGIEPQFGADSFSRHLQLARHAGLTAQLLDRTNLGLDIDTPSDIAVLLATGRRTQTTAVLDGLNVGARLTPAPDPPGNNHARARALVSP